MHIHSFAFLFLFPPSSRSPSYFFQYFSFLRYLTLSFLVPPFLPSVFSSFSFFFTYPSRSTSNPFHSPPIPLSLLFVLVLSSCITELSLRPLVLPRLASKHRTGKGKEKKKGISRKRKSGRRSGRLGVPCVASQR